MLSSISVRSSFLRLSSRCWYSSHSNSPAITTIHTIHDKYAQGMPLTMCTAYDCITANWVHASNSDMILVGDSLAMTALGYDSTTDLSLEEFEYHLKSVCRSKGPAIIVADMPFGSFESSIETGISNAIALMKLSSKVASLKLEVGLHSKDTYTISLIKEICSRGIPVMGHIGLTPQKIHSLGGYKVQGNKKLEETREICETALLLQEAGCWALVLECIPHKVASYITTQLSIPTIGIGAGNGTSGQVLVISDLLGMKDGHLPKFVRKYANLHDQSIAAICDYNQEVRERKYPDQDRHTFKIKDELWKTFIENKNTIK